MTPEDAEDAVHEAMLRAAERPGLDDERLGGWLTTVTMRLCVDRYRQVRREAEVHRSPTLRVPGPVPVEEAVCDRDEARWLAARSAQLPQRQAEALRLKAEGLDVGEVAVRMRLGYRTVESLLARARRTLRATLAGTLGLGLVVWGRAKVIGGGAAQAVLVSSATVGVVVAGYVVPGGGGAAGANPGVGPGVRAEPGPGSSSGAAGRVVAEPGVVESSTGRVTGVVPRGREVRDVSATATARAPGWRESGDVVGLRPRLALPSVTLLGLTISLPALLPTPRGSAPDPAPQSPAGLDLPTSPPEPLDLPRSPTRLELPTSPPEPLDLPRSPTRLDLPTSPPEPLELPRSPAGLDLPTSPPAPLDLPRSPTRLDLPTSPPEPLELPTSPPAPLELPRSPARLDLFDSPHATRSPPTPPPAPPSPRTPEKKSAPIATDRPSLPVEHMSEVRRGDGRRGSGWGLRSGWKGLPSRSGGSSSGGMFR
ncbi:sigma-70 family RNA polymerase sigma factor [Streptomyces sp. CC224E]|uniref:sigma-70 family RNA polymerase sigma factor n=1 Tax=unclassified Streptomyces TaxID=2593676 RepID=UPI0035587DD8